MLKFIPFPITNQYYNNDIIYIRPLVICYIAIENDHRNSGFTQLEMVDLSIVCCKRFPEGIPWETGGMPENNPITNWCFIYVSNGMSKTMFYYRVIVTSPKINTWVMKGYTLYHYSEPNHHGTICNCNYDYYNGIWLLYNHIIVSLYYSKYDCNCIL